MIAVIPTTGSNIFSIVNALQKLSQDIVVTEDPELIRKASKVILPGVGHARSMMDKLQKAGLAEVIPTLTQPVLGICLGMQILFEHSEEGDTKTLGVIPGRVKRIPFTEYSLPHLGWNKLEDVELGSWIAPFRDEHFYFVHSYMVEQGPWVKASCDYGLLVPSVIQWQNFYGTQFHPERSARVGEKLLQRFLCL
ncbi:MAG: imidazole glycerol phosphate synthase subunit HisH [Bdellovibrionota bacterium]|nr:MAG: imidazole glycerol phosphate synthase subunit HisH [Pseudomonadota bacterium]